MVKLSENIMVYAQIDSYVLYLDKVSPLLSVSIFHVQNG